MPAVDTEPTGGTDPRVAAFMAALQDYEHNGDPSALVERFAPDAELTRVGGSSRPRGEIAAFWQEYRAAFAAVSTTFTHVTGTADGYALEWASAATLTNQRPLSYRGVTVLDFDGETIRALRTYYDTAAFTPAPAPAH